MKLADAVPESVKAHLSAEMLANDVELIDSRNTIVPVTIGLIEDYESRLKKADELNSELLSMVLDLNKRIRSMEDMQKVNRLPVI